jgi:diguanylate cyclase
MPRERRIPKIERTRAYAPCQAHHLPIKRKGATNIEDLGRKVASQAATIASLRRKLAAMTIESRIDTLTNLPNRRDFDARLAAAFSNAARNVGGPLTVALFDLDHFKRVNDTFGHPVGDEVLRKVGDILRKFARTSDYVARIGGEEFAFILQGTLCGQAVNLIERLRKTFEDELVVETSCRQVRVTASFGVAQWQLGETPAQLLVRADKVLYHAKDCGRNCVSAL